MARNYAQGLFMMKNPDRYVGKKPPFARSSWETNFMNFLDSHPSVINWANEPLHINYYDPTRAKNTIYIPDFLMVYQHKSGEKLAELIEIKPLSQAVMTEGKRLKPQDAAVIVRNRAKWAAAVNFCKQYNMTFRVLTENQIFHMGGKSK